jgi:NADH:ubiquinone oxidoreductase subunit F (NADH-binding)
VLFTLTPSVLYVTGDEHDPVKTRIVHGMVLGSFAVSAYTVLPFLSENFPKHTSALISSVGLEAAVLPR